MTHPPRIHPIALLGLLPLMAHAENRNEAPLLVTANAAAARAAESESPVGSFEIVEDPVSPSPAGGPSIRITTEKPTRNWWQFQFTTPTAGGVAKGDTLHLGFWARVVEVEDETGEGSIQAYFQENRSPWRKSFERLIRVGPEWRHFQFPFRSEGAYPAGKAALGFAFGHQAQTVEIAGVGLVNHGASVEPDALPRTRLLYAGHEPDAPWREEAAVRIDRHRKADLRVVVRDAAGEPVEGAMVRVAMTRHAFAFGSAVVPHLIMEDSENGAKYREVVEDWFNHVSIENALKWKGWEERMGSPGDRKKTLAGLEWLKEREIPVHGHVLVWPSWKFTPTDLRALKDDPEALAARVDAHIGEMVSVTEGLTYEWDVVNEAYTNNDLLKILGEDAINHWFRLAHETNPDLRLYYNDYGIVATGGATDTPHQQFVYDLVERLRADNVPIGGLGIQGHFGETVTPPATVLKILDRFAGLGLPLQVTEFDVDTDDEDLQARYTRDFMTTVFSHPAVNGFVMWGFWEGRHWRPRAAMFTRDWTMKPHGKVFEELVFNEWWTDASGATDAEGVFATRGFLGDYAITVGGPDGPVGATLTLGSPGEALTIILPIPDSETGD